MSWREFGDWKHDALAALRRRNATQSKPFDELIGAYNDALAGEREQKRRREELEREVIILRHELATLTHSRMHELRPSITEVLLWPRALCRNSPASHVVPFSG